MSFHTLYLTNFDLVMKVCGHIRKEILRSTSGSCESEPCAERRKAIN